MKHPKPWRYDRVMDNIYDAINAVPILEAISEEAAIEAVEAVNEREDLIETRDKLRERLKKVVEQRDEVTKLLEECALRMLRQGINYDNAEQYNTIQAAIKKAKGGGHE